MSASVSVCIPAYNSAGYIGRTVESILGQSHGDLELIVVDDRSTDGTVEVLRAYERDPRFRLLTNEQNLGAVANWNRALGVTTAPFVKLVCGDDVLYPTCLERQVTALEAHPAASMAASRRDIIDDRDRTLFRDRGLAGLSGPVDGNAAIRTTVQAGTNIFGEPFSVLMRRHAIEQAGAFRDRAYVIDLDYWIRLLQVGDLVAVPETLGAFRVVPTSWSRRIGRDQGAQNAALFREVRAELPEVVSAGDLRRGAALARLQNVARLVLYRLLRF